MSISRSGWGRRFTQYEKDVIVTLYHRGESACAIAKEIHATDTGIRQYLLKNGLKLQSSNLGRERKTTRKSTQCPTPTGIGWIAGFLEGEGSFTRMGHSQQITCSQSQREPLERLQAFLGGSVRSIPNTGFGKKPQYRWQICGSRARGVIFTLYVLMSPRRKGQMRAALSHLLVQARA